jgi:hypothetical protein
MNVNAATINLAATPKRFCGHTGLELVSFTKTLIKEKNSGSDPA